MIEITKQPFLENLCVLLICHDARLDDFTEHLTRLYDPCVDTVHVCVSKELNLFKRAKFMRQVRDMFTDADIHIRNVTEAQIKLLAFYIYVYATPEENNETLPTRRHHPSPQRRDVPMPPPRQREPQSQRLSLREHAQKPDFPLRG
jgi:hypothetical protein